MSVPKDKKMKASMFRDIRVDIIPEHSNGRYLVRLVGTCVKDDNFRILDHWTVHADNMVGTETMYLSSLDKIVGIVEEDK